MWYEPWYEIISFKSSLKNADFGGSERGTRTPDPRIMIPVLRGLISFVSFFVSFYAARINVAYNPTPQRASNPVQDHAHVVVSTYRRLNRVFQPSGCFAT
jgi:hypothetical protein